MNRILPAAILFASAQIADAAMLDIAETPGTTGTIYALTLTAGEQFNGFGVNIVPVPPAKLLNPGEGGLFDSTTTEKTFLSVYLEGAPAIDLSGFSAVGKEVTADRMRSDYGLLGRYIDGSGGIYLGNVLLPAGGGGQLQHCAPGRTPVLTSLGWRA